MRLHKRQRFELTIDLLKGCGNNCAGCMVDKKLGGYLEDTVEILELVKEMKNDGFIMFDLGIGPTDYMSSNNSKEVLNNSNVIEIIRNFDAITFNAAFLEKDMSKYISMCNEIDEVAYDKEIRFLIPAVPKYFKNDKFGNMVKEKISFIQKTLKRAKLYEASFIINCTDETMSDDFDNCILNSINLEFPVKKDNIINIPYGRSVNKNILMTNSIRNISYRVSDFYLNIASIGDGNECFKNPDLNYNDGLATNMVYLNGNLYWVPFLKDEYVFIHDDFIIPKPWNINSILNTRTNAMNDSIDYLQNAQCGTCEYFGSCAEKGVTSIMKTLKTKKCMVGL